MLSGMVSRQTPQIVPQSASSKTRRKRRRRAKGEGSVSWDAQRQRWRGEIHIDGKRHRVDALTEAEAARKLGALLHGDQRQRDQDRKASLAALLEEWQTK